MPASTRRIVPAGGVGRILADPTAIITTSSAKHN
jgi:hypothetical protein